jgi:predicted nucleotidyltransferase
VLESNDLIIEEASGNRRLVRINRDRLSVPDDPILQIPQSEYHKPVNAAVDALTDAIDNVLGILLYGSVARGEADRRSDIDLWVLVTEDRPAAQRAANTIALDLEEREFEGNRYAYDIDVEDASTVPVYTEDIREIVLSGIPVYKKSRFDIVERFLMNEVERDE